MSKYTISQAHLPTYEELEKWSHEAGYFQHHSPNPRAPRDSPEGTGWGIPVDFMPPPDAVEYVLAMFKREVAGVPLGEQLRPEFKFSILSVCMAHFMWLRTDSGARWLLRFYGTEEVPPFWLGYAYFYVDPGTGTPVHISKDSGIELRIFRSCERNLNPPIDSEYNDAILEMQELLRQVRSPKAVEPIPEASGEMYFWISEQLRGWFNSTQPNKHWPTAKGARVSGYQWAKNLERKKGVLFYEALDKLEMFKPRAYRLKDKRGGILWCGTSDMKIAPLPDVYRNQSTMTDHQLENAFRCSSCHKMRPCLPVTGDQKLCCRCHGSIIERDERPTLDWCMMRECQLPSGSCPSAIDSYSDLVNLKNRLNRDPEFPVRR